MEKRTSIINVRLTPTTKSELSDLAKSEGRTVSNYVEQLIIEQIKKSGK